MAERRIPALFLPNYRSADQAARAMMAPHWFVREAVGLFSLSPAAQVVFYQIADNLSAEGVARVSMGLIAQRAGIHRSTVVEMIAILCEHRILVELDEKRSGAIMRYGIPRDLPIPAGYVLNLSAEATG